MSARNPCLTGAAITDALSVDPATCMTPMQLRRMVDAADERAAADDERADIGQAYELIARYDELGLSLPAADYAYLVRLVGTFEAIARRTEITRPRVITAQSDTDPRRTYRVTRRGSQWYCSCLGFEHRGRCKHSDAAAGKVAPTKSRKLRGALRGDHERDLAGGSLALVAASLEAAR